MSDLRGLVKGGWHPKGKDGGKESWRGDFKGINQVAGWMGKGKSSEAQAAQEHVSRPLATLKDPSSFGPPPKNVNYHGGAALPNQITPHTGGLGAPLSQAEIESARRAAASAETEEEEEAARPPPPSLPYRADRTGLKTDHLPPPPPRRDLQHGGVSPSQSPAPGSRSRPPPPLPVRQNTTSPVQESAPPTYEAVQSKAASSSYINQTAVDRLGRAGVSVPGLGIGNQAQSNPWQEERSQSQTHGTGQLSELQSRFARMNSSSQETGVNNASEPNEQASPPSQTNMPSWQQSQSTLRTAQNLRNNPQSVSLADAQSAAQTAGQAQRSASAFKEKHADSIAKGQAKAKAWDQKFKVTSKINKFLDEQSGSETQQHQHQQQAQTSQYQAPVQAAHAYTSPPQSAQYPSTVPQPVVSPSPTELTASIARKPPPPPAPRKPANLQAPPPVPTGTKPNFG